MPRLDPTIPHSPVVVKQLEKRAADVQLRGLEFAVFDVFESIEYVLFSRNSKLRGIAETHTNEHRVKILLQLGDSRIDAHFLAGFKLGAETLYHGGFGKRNFHRFAEHNNAVSRETAGQLTLFVQRHGNAQLGEFTGAR